MTRNPIRRVVALMVVTGGLLTTSVGVAASPALASAPERQTYFICPSVSLNNSQGMWVVGAHGAYYVLVPTQGYSGSKVYLTTPVQVASLAQIPAGWALYDSYPSFPNFEGGAGLLQEGIDTWLGSPAGWNEGDMAMVTNNGDGTYTVFNVTQNASVTIAQPIPLASAAVW
jgi:hypothetical protein